MALIAYFSLLKHDGIAQPLPVVFGGRGEYRPFFFIYFLPRSHESRMQLLEILRKLREKHTQLRMKQRREIKPPASGN